MRIWSKASWTTLLFILVAEYIAGAIFMPLYEPAESALQNVGLSGYSWWFVVTITTIGYGDITPVTEAGRLIAIFIMVSGIGTLGLTLGKIAEFTLNIGRKRMLGKIQLHVNNHVVIFGNRGQETLALLTELKNDVETAKRTIVLCSQKTLENPFPGQVEFVNGDMTSVDVLTRACVSKADRIIIHSDNDDRSAMIALGVRSVNKTAHVVVNLDFAESELNLQRVGEGHGIACVKPVSVRMLVRELNNPGITLGIEALLGSEGQDINVLTVPDGFGPWNFGDLLMALKIKYNILIYAAVPKGVTEIDGGMNPKMDSFVTEGATLHYIAQGSLEGKIDWGNIK